MSDTLCGFLILAFFVVGLGCAGQGDYEYRKHQADKQKIEVCKKNTSSRCF